MRADARRNRTRLLDAAVGVVLELGPDVPLDAIARRADVGIGTLYRHFPDRDRLLAAVAEHTLERSIEAAQMALAEGTDGRDVLRRYLHAAVGAGVGVLNLLHPVLDGPDWGDQRARVAPLLDAVLQRGRDDRTLRRDIVIADVVFAAIRFSRPIAIGLPRHEERALAHRHLDIYVDGLGTVGPVSRTAAIGSG